MLINGRLISLDSRVASGLNDDPPLPLPGCSRNQACDQLSCSGRGSCEGFWESYQCLCNSAFTDPDCSAGKHWPGLYFISVNCRGQSEGRARARRGRSEGGAGRGRSEGGTRAELGRSEGGVLHSLYLLQPALL